MALRFGTAFAAALACASQLSAERLIVRTYTVSDGLGSNAVNCIATDRDGFLWVCTTNGLSRFDGTRFVTFGTADGLPNSNVNHFLQTRSGSRWVATNGGGIARLEPSVPGGDRVFTAYPVGGTPRTMRVNVLLETSEGAALAGTDGGLFRSPYLDPEPRFELVPLALPGFPDTGLQIWSIAEDAAGRIWVGTSAGLVLLRGLEPAGHMHIAAAQGADHVWHILPDTAGRLWLGHDRGLFVWHPLAGNAAALSGGPALIERAGPCVIAGKAGEAATIPALPGSACLWSLAGAEQGRSALRSLYRTEDGWIWMAAEGRLSAFDGSGFRRFDATQGMPVSVLQQVGEDPGGDVWVGSISGVHRIQRRGFTYFTAADGLIGPSVERILSGPDGRVYAISSANVIHRLDGERWTAVRPNLPPLAGVVGRSVYGAALIDHTGGWWVGTGGGLLRFPAVAGLEALARSEAIAHYTTGHGLAGDDIWHLFEDSQGDIWIATRVPGAEPLTRWERGSGLFHRYGVPEGLPSERAVRSFAEDYSGALWVSFWDGGLARFDGRRFRYFSPGTDVPTGHLYQLMIDSRGWLWVAGQQLFYSRDPTAPRPRFETFQTPGRQSLFATAISEDLDGWIYAATRTGLVRFAPEDGRLQQLGRGHPFISDRPRPFHRDSAGTLWFLTAGGILRYEARPLHAGVPPPVRIGGVSIAGVPLPVPPMGATSLSPLRLAAGQRQVQIDYFGLGFGLDEPLRFQVRLDGVDDGWSSPTSQLTVFYAGLGPGRYRFQVRAVSATGQVSAEPATMAFTISPPVWRRAWFLAVLSMLLAAGLVAAHGLRVRRLLELERVRTRIATDLHDDLGASLARVSLLSEATRRKLSESPEAAERMLGEIGETSRALVSTAGDIAFAIDPGRGRLDGLVARLRRFTEDLLAGTDIDWSFEVEGDASEITLSSDQRRHLLAILKEALHNAVRHGQPGQLTLRVAVRGGILEAELADDGRGFPADVAAGAVPSAGHGLRNMRQRAREAGGRLDVESHPGAGTILRLRLPL